MSKLPPDYFFTDLTDDDWPLRSEAMCDKKYDWDKHSTQELLTMRIVYKDDEELYKRIKEVLATRPHIPNKQESKALRKQKAHNQRHR